MNLSTSGLLLLLVGFFLLSGFLTGNLDRWVGYLFDPKRPPLSNAGGGGFSGGSSGGGGGGAGGGFGSVQQGTAGRTA